ncbi:Uncharacterized protein Adt_45499 [Abeliophyllum distichum]|uniref:Uncharacterized protein n=1 Tax=Abeliophyllum distichum TaxID=126358 RepID=A0ABD1PDU5_9LAMI
MEGLMMDMNQKYGSLVAMMAQLSADRSEPKEMQIESSIANSKSGNGLSFPRNGGEEVVETFQERFEELKAQVIISLPHLLESYYISIFTSGLKSEVKSMVKIMKLDTIAKAFKIAFLQETTITAINKYQKPKPFNNNTSKWTPQPAKPPDINHNQTPESISKTAKPPMKFKGH